MRPLSLARYLPEFGWQSIVLTSKSPEYIDSRFEVVETKLADSLILIKKLLKINTQQTLMSQIAQLKRILGIRSSISLFDKLLALIGEVTAYPDFQKGWRRVATESAHTIFHQNDVRAIISSSPPVTAHIVAQELKNTFKVPWIADFQDLWTQNHYYPYSSIRRKKEKRLELKTLFSADALVTVSEPITAELGKLHKDKAVHSVPIGFNPEEINDTSNRLTQKLTLTYTGNIYPGRQSPEPLFDTLNKLISEGNVISEDIEIRFYGTRVNWIDEMANKHGLTSLVKQYGIVDREAAIKKQRESQVLLLLKWNDPGQKGVYTAKIFEYLAAKRPILAIGDYKDVVDDLLQETKAGFSIQRPDELKDVVLNLYREYKQQGSITYNGNEIAVNKYSQREMARKYATILNGVII